jgi:non-specific serine/threonine protein kinase
METDARPSFAALLQEYRLARGLTQNELAEAASLSREAINVLERGARRSPRRDTVALIARALGLSGDERARLLAAAVAARTRGSTAHDSSPLATLPIRLTSFVGREREVAEVTELLLGQRLVTLCGPGGIGKTSLALVVATRAREHFTDGAALVDLAGLTDGDLVSHVVAEALGVRERLGEPILATVGRALATTQRLPVIDNCEHLVEACARVVETLLQACPRLHILATSREPLRVGPEVIWRVPALTLPEQNHPPLAVLARSEAVRLFVERAAVVRPGFALTAENAAPVAEICLRLDGIPLAIELAAARARVLTAVQIAARLDDRFRLLTGGSRTALRRQQTLQATLDWSYQLLSEEERTLLRRLAVFAAGFTVEAAEAVGEGEEIVAADFLDLLSALVDKSLVVAEDAGAHERYRLLETIRQYAGDRLFEAGEVGPVRDRHRDWYAGLAACAETELNGPGQAEWLGRLESEHDNLRAALAWSLESDPKSGLRLAASLGGFWMSHGHHVEGRRWLEAFLTRASVTNDPEDRRARARALQRAGSMASEQQDRGAAWAFLEESLTLFRALGDQRGTALALNAQGYELLRVGAGAERIRSTLEESLSLWRALGDQLGVASTLLSLSYLAARERDDARARRLLDEALALSRASGLSDRGTRILVAAGWFAWGRGDLARARRDLEEGLEIARRLGFKVGIGLALMALGCLALDEGDRTRARASLEESARNHRASGTTWAFYLGLAYLGHRAVDQGRNTAGVRLLAAVETEYPHYAIFASIQPLAHPAERAQATAAARAALGDEAFAAAWAAGQAMTLESAVELALAEGE